VRILPFGAAQDEIRFADFAVFAVFADLGSAFSGPKTRSRK